MLLPLNAYGDRNGARDLFVRYVMLPPVLVLFPGPGRLPPTTTTTAPFPFTRPSPLPLSFSPRADG